MIFKYQDLNDVITSKKIIKIDDHGQIQYLDNDYRLDAIKFVSKIEIEQDYYCFLRLPSGQGVVFYSDGNSFDGFSVFQVDLNEFYFDLNEKKGVLGIEDGVGNETDFLDLFTGPAIGHFSREYQNKDDDEIEKSPVYKVAQQYLGNYLGYTGEDEKTLNITLLKFLMAIYFDQNPAVKK